MGYGLHLSAADFRGAQGLTQTAAVPGRRVAKGFVLATIVINMLGVGLAWPVLPKIIQHMGGGDVSGAAFTYGVLAGGFALAQFFFQPLTGVLSDRFGRKPILLAALAGAGADFALVAWAPSLIWVAAARILGGIFASTNATANAYMADISEPEDRSRNFGLVGAAFGFGFIAGPLIGGVLGGIDLRLPFLFAAGLAALNFTFGLFFLPESLAPEDRKPFSPSNANPFGALARLTRLPGLAPLMLSLFLVAVAQRGLEATWVLFLDFRFGWGVREASFSLAFVGIMSVIVQGGLVGPVVARFGEWRTVWAGFLLSAVSLAAYGLATQGWMVFPLIAFHILGDALALPALTAICSKAAPRNEQGLVQGTLGAVNSLAIVAGPFSASMVLGFVTASGTPLPVPGAWFMISAVFFLAGAMIVRRKTPKLHKTVTS